MAWIIIKKVVPSDSGLEESIHSRKPCWIWTKDFWDALAIEQTGRHWEIWQASSPMFMCWAMGDRDLIWNFHTNSHFSYVIPPWDVVSPQGKLKFEDSKGHFSCIHPEKNGRAETESWCYIHSHLYKYLASNRLKLDSFWYHVCLHLWLCQKSRDNFCHFCGPLPHLSKLKGAKFMSQFFEPSNHNWQNLMKWIWVFPKIVVLPNHPF